MRVLWLCNLIIPEFAEVFSINKTFFGGWISGMLNLLKDSSGYDISFCFPVYDVNRLHDGEHNGHRFYSFHAFLETEKNLGQDHSDLENRMKEILVKELPDIIHIWGSEYYFSLAMMDAAISLGLQDKVLLHVQGLISQMEEPAKYGIPDEYLDMKVEGFDTLRNESRLYKIRGEHETELISKCKHICGRTSWDKEITLEINKNRQYYLCEEVLRKQIYDAAGTWNIKDVDSHRIFLSQASYSIKGLHILLPQIGKLKKIYTDIVVRIGGASPFNKNDKGELSPYGKLINDIIEKEDIKENIILLGMLSAEQMVDEYRKANVFICPSTIENSSNSVDEAMMIGTPVISTNAGGMRDRIEEEEGFTVDVANTTDLSEIIDGVLSGKLDLSVLNRAACKKSKNRHGCDLIKKQISKIYNNIGEEINDAGF